MKRIYFVRHGESEANVSGDADGPDSPLTAQGERQASVLAERFAKLDVDLVISSTYLRARETAHIINEVIKKPIEFSELLVEKRSPSSFIGTKQNEMAELKTAAMLKHFLDPHWKHSDEDDFTEMKQRTLEALDYVLKRPEEKILIVTHGWFLRTLIAVQLFGESLTVSEYHRVWKYLTTRNTGITLTEYDPQNVNQGWRLITWNDHAHLG